MLDFTRLPRGFLDGVTRVVDAVVSESTALVPDDVMLVGAWCRDSLHFALGFTFQTSATGDVDLALALNSWDVFHQLASAFPSAGDSGVRFRIADALVDLLPFGAIEDPIGFVEPPTRHELMSVWSFDEVFKGAIRVALTPERAIRVPTVAGFAATKAGAWLDRHVWGETKDAGDLALILYWYIESTSITDRLYESDEGNAVLIAEKADVAVAAAHLLGVDIATTIGPVRLGELLARWPGDGQRLARRLRLYSTQPWPAEKRRRELLEGLTRGLQNAAPAS